MRPAKHSLQIQSRHVVGSRPADPIGPSSIRRRRGAPQFCPVRANVGSSTTFGCRVRCLVTSVGSVIVAIARASRRSEETKCRWRTALAFGRARVVRRASCVAFWTACSARCDRAGASFRRHKRFEVVGGEMVSSDPS